MSYLFNTNSEYLSARITNKGRQKISQGNFNIQYFQVGDSEFDYTFSEYDGILLSQKIFTPLDKDSIVKYPYKLSESPITGTTFGNPIQSSQIETIKNKMGEAGFVSKYTESGSAIECYSCEIGIKNINGTSLLEGIISGMTFVSCGYITIVFMGLAGPSGTITGSSASLVYKVVTGNTSTLTLDRNMPDLSAYDGIATIICNNCSSSITDPCAVNTDPLDPWALNIVWSQKPAGMDVPSIIDERQSGYTSNVFVSTKEFLGYNISSGQTYNTGTTINNSFGDDIIVLPEEQHSLAIIHYNQPNTESDPERFFKYEDYISHDEEETDYFEVYIPFIQYHRNPSTAIGARFFMDHIDYYINSSASDTKRNKIKYRYLIDEIGVRVGKVFVHNKIIVFDDQEIVAALDYKSNRKYTLPIPRISQIPVDVKCGVDNRALIGLLQENVEETVFVSYLLCVSTDRMKNGLHCNHYTKIESNNTNSDVSIKFSDTDFTYMKSQLSDFVDGYVANEFYILVQKVDKGEQPEPNLWKIIDFTTEIPNHTPGDYIDPDSLRGTRFIITNDQYEDAVYYDIENFMETDYPNEPSSLPQFGDEQPFPGSIVLTRATDLHVMRYLINLPTGQFETTQNPTWTSDKSKRITEIALLDENKDVVVIAKTPKPIVRIGTQVFVVKIDI